MATNLTSYTKRNLERNFFPKFNVTVLIIIANIIFFLTTYTILFFNQGFMEFISLKPSNIIHGKYLWTFLTSMFMHANFLHLFVNMFVLFSLGEFCETIIGKKRFFWFYIISGLAAGIAFVILSGFFGHTKVGEMIFGSPDIAGVGASGAIFAIAGLFMILTPNLKFAIIFLPFFALPAYIMIPLVLFATWLVSAGTGLPIGNTAHFGGFLAGILYGTYLRKRYYRKVIMLNRMIE